MRLDRGSAGLAAGHSAFRSACRLSRARVGQPLPSPTHQHRCDKEPLDWCDAHHIVSWADGGPTDIANLTLLCGHHHRLIHDDAGWRIRVASDGRPEFLPPSWLDRERRPRRNQCYRRT
ncbi:HNH endonuclease [Actinoplanes hulinensis]|uniref:HNH endonuclease n=1 Tax=Actinoplanes hulinensis TaxID=1144547 RepID=A0ABS7BG51_9ACTN|nr:HNH endonuclease signature motif containing protein [Actinoplanes hulinensis]MBW6439872.1 HNH endonuclease [Actinoplanes hulinensis]